MSHATRIALLHTGAVVISPIMEFVKRELPDATAINYLDDRIVADLSDAERAASVPVRIADLALKTTHRTPAPGPTTAAATA